MKSKINRNFATNAKKELFKNQQQQKKKTTSKTSFTISKDVLYIKVKYKK